MDEIYVKSDSVVEKRVGKELVLVPLSDNIANMAEVFTLNEVGTFIFENFNGKNAVSSIVAKVIDRFEVDVETASNDVNSFIQSALIKKVIKPDISSSNK